MSKSKESFLLAVTKGALVPADNYTAERDAKLEKKRQRQARYRERHRETLRIKNREYAKNERAEKPDVVRARSRASYRKHQAVRNENTKRWQRDNADRWSQTRRVYREARKEELSEKFAQWRATSPDKARSACVRWREKNAERVKATRRKWYDKNKPKAFAAAAKRRADRVERTPAWADLEAIGTFYAICPAGYHVDHVIPLKGRFVSGLHVEYNLQYLPARQNISKGNRYES